LPRLDQAVHPLSWQAPFGGERSARDRGVLSHLATDLNVAASTRNQTLSLLGFFYQEVLDAAGDGGPVLRDWHALDGMCAVASVADGLGCPRLYPRRASLGIDPNRGRTLAL